MFHIILITGDFNCQPGSRFYNALQHLIDDNHLIMTDVSMMSSLSSVFTYCSDSGCNDGPWL